MSESMPEVSPAEKVRAAMEGIGESTTTSPVVEIPQPIVTEPTPITTEPAPVATNPSWNDILADVPEVLHAGLIPKLQAWDKGVQDQLTKYKPLEEFSTVSPEELRVARQLYQTLNQDPQRVYEQLRQHLGIQDQQQQTTTEPVEIGEEGDEDFEDPRLTEIQNNQRQMMEYLQRQQADQEAKKADAWVGEQQKQVTARFKAKGIEIGNTEWEHILSSAAGFGNSGMDPNLAMQQAANSFEQLITQLRPSANSGAPLLMPPGGSTPAPTPINVATMDDKTHKKYTTELLAQAMKDIK